MHSLSMGAMDASVVRPNRSLLLLLLFTALLFLGMPDALAHAVTTSGIAPKLVSAPSTSVEGRCQP